MAFRWNKIVLTDDAGGPQDGVAPVIISASRSTDIPAFYSEWLLNRFRRGHCVWINPFNGVPQYVSFAQTRFFVFWSKNPRPLLEKLPEIDKRGVGYYVQFTLNNYDEEEYEPRVPKVVERVDTFKRLADRIGKQRVIWRFDPLMLTERVTVPILLERIEKLMKELHDYTEKLVISFADLEAYQKVKQNLKRSRIAAREFTREEMETTARRIGELAKEHGLRVATCAEKMDLDRYGIEHNRCIDNDLIAKCCPQDRELMAFLGRTNTATQAELFETTAAPRHATERRLKDSGQREDCGCVMSKDIGSYNTCPHLCVYCYANSSPEVVGKRFATHKHNPVAESI